MIWLVLLLIVAFLLGYLVWMHSDDTPPPIDPEQAMKAAVELHAIRRRLDVARTRTEQRRDVTRVRREIAEAMTDDSAP